MIAQTPVVSPPDPQAVVSVRALVKCYQGRPVVNALSLVIPRWSFYGIVGPNGAGKTTTLDMMTGLLVPDSGNVMILGMDVWSDVDTAKLIIGVMPQGDQIFDRLTGLQPLVYSGMLRRMPRSEMLGRAKDLLDAFDLTDAGGKRVCDYSSGMTKKICLASWQAALTRGGG